MIYSNKSYIIPLPKNEVQMAAVQEIVDAIGFLDKSMIVRTALLVKSDNPAIQGLLDWLSRLDEPAPVNLLLAFPKQVFGTADDFETELPEIETEHGDDLEAPQSGSLLEIAQRSAEKHPPKARTVAECKSCHEVKKIKAKGLCGPCYARFGENYAPARRTAKAKSTTTEQDKAADIDADAQAAKVVLPSGVERIQQTAATHTKGGAAWQRIQENVDRIVRRNNSQAAG